MPLNYDFSHSTSSFVDGQPLETTTHSIHHIRNPVKSSSLSFRDTPGVTFKTIENCIKHYKEKAKGKYGEKVAARYLFEMTSELEKQIAAMKEKEGAEMKRLYKEIQWLRRVVKEWEFCFGMEFSETDCKEMKDQKDKENLDLNTKLERLTPQQVKRRMEFQEKEMNKLQKQVSELKLDAERKRHVYQKGVEEAHEQARLALHAQIQQISESVSQMHQQNEATFKNVLQSKNELIHLLENEISELKNSVTPLKESMEEYKAYASHVVKQMSVMKDAIITSKKVNNSIYKELLNYQNEMQNNFSEGANIHPEDDSPKPTISANNTTTESFANNLQMKLVNDLKAEIVKQQQMIKELKEIHKKNIEAKDQEIEQVKLQKKHISQEKETYGRIIRELEKARLMSDFHEIKKMLSRSK